MLDNNNKIIEYRIGKRFHQTYIVKNFSKYYPIIVSIFFINPVSQQLVSAD